MHLQKMDFCYLSACDVCLSLYICSALCARLSVPIVMHQIVSNLQWMFRSRATTFFRWWVSGGCQSTTRWITTSSTDHRDSAISSRITSLLLSRYSYCSFACSSRLSKSYERLPHRLLSQGTVCNRPLQETAKRTILYPLKSTSMSAYFRLILSIFPLPNFFPNCTVRSIVNSIFDC